MQSSVHQSEILLFFTLLQRVVSVLAARPAGLKAIASDAITVPALRAWLRREVTAPAGTVR